MSLTVTQFKKDFKKRLHEKYAIEVEDASNVEWYGALGSLVKAYYSKSLRKTHKQYIEEETKQAYYFSIEFLPGKMLKSNLLNLGILDVVRDGLKSMSIELEDVMEAEPDMALGNGGLGRLASCFMDSAASCALPVHGNGIRYDYGLFKQRFVDGYQVELPDSWLQGGNPWEVRRENKAVEVRMGGTIALVPDNSGNLIPRYYNAKVLRAIPYDTHMVGYENGVVNNLRLWSVEIPVTEEGNYLTLEERQEVENITAVLYPDDSNYDGRQLRLKQEYFFVSAGLQSIVNYYLRSGQAIEELPEKVAVHINDTHPAMCVPELMRILLDEAHLSWEKAWNITVKVMSYTNHTLMAEALEKWPTQMVEEIVPRIYQIIQEIDRRFVADVSEQVGCDIANRTRIIQNDHVHMAHLAIIGSHSTNGVAKIHSDLLKNVVLHDFYLLYPERFNNKTNGIAERRWLQLSNEELSGVLDETIGKTWRKDPGALKLLEAYRKDKKVLKKIAQAKQHNKKNLAAFIKQEYDIEVSSDAIFDVQIKRLHAYKRQLLNLLHIVKLYLDLKENPDRHEQARVFIFGAKAAPSYDYAKTIIKCINEVAAMVNHDPDIKGKLKIAFLPNYNVSLAEKIIPAADVSEQISLASKEASGTSNMKLMLNGAVTLATLDGANIEIKDAVGEENIVIFGLTTEEVYQYYRNNNYNAREIYENDPTIYRVLNAFVDGTIPNISREGQEIFDSLVKYNDEYFTLRDFNDYVKGQETIAAAYQDTERWGEMCLMNIANAGRFSADQTVERYAEDIWHIEAVTTEE